MLHARGLMETSELGEMIHQSDKFEDDGMMEFLSVDEHLSRIETIVVNIDNELGQMITSFSNTSGYFKKRITALENAYNSNKKQIVSDLYSGVLRTGYDKMAILEHKELAL
uniref:Uncharacterized protein n=1 Tax=Caenorhabditis japonica TaxID=281687 RepID=A0A8R1INA1_CAEJA